ncbi:MAG: hypothetical protein EBU49_14250, partial [Proteobacteria bacterium]|nr:hypothetical protein [Pseudomonadota bacterium]
MVEPLVEEIDNVPDDVNVDDGETVSTVNGEDDPYPGVLPALSVTFTQTFHPPSEVIHAELPAG